MGEAAFYGCNNLTNVIINNGVSNIASWAFAYCGSLTTVTIGRDVGEIGGYGMRLRDALISKRFIFEGLRRCSIVVPSSAMLSTRSFFTSGVPGWGSAFGDRPAVPYFAFNITGTNGLTVVVEATTDLINPAWAPLQTNAFDGIRGFSRILSG